LSVQNKENNKCSQRRKNKIVTFDRINHEHIAQSGLLTSISDSSFLNMINYLLEKNSDGYPEELPQSKN
jgi:hypothetical protein